jgi:ParB/RepB/Spo0J family partition protein
MSDLSDIQQRMIPLAAIVASDTNPRKTFNKAKLEELTQSIKLHGVMQPILVRPVDDGEKFRIVAGERRFKASQAAGRAEIPAMVRPLTDAQALELQVIENNQREDLHPLEEAEGYEALLKCKHEDGSKYTVVEIATKVSRTRGYVYQKLKLCALCPEARKAFYDEKIDFSKALLLARIVGDNLQRAALKEISEKNAWGGEPMNFRDAQRHVQQHYMLALDKAPFSTADATLVPKAGACADCPKRTGNAPELFNDVKSGDVCTDPGCFDSKRSAHTVRLVEAAKAKGQEVITGKDAKKIAPHGTHDLKGYLALDQSLWTGKDNKTVRQLLGKDSPKPVLLEDPQTHELIEVVKEKDADPILKAKLPKPAKTSGGNDFAKKQREKEQKARQERELRQRIYFAGRDHVAKSGLQTEDVRMIVAAVWARHWHDHKKAIAPWWFPDDVGKGKKVDRIDTLTKRIATMDGGDLLRLLVDCAIVGSIATTSYGAAAAADEVEAFAKRHGVDVAGLKRQAAIDAKAKADGKASAKKPATGKKPTKAP